MAEPILEELFDAPIKIKLLKFFGYNSDQDFLIKEVAKRLKIKPGFLARHLIKLQSLGFLKTKLAKETKIKTRQKKAGKKSKKARKVKSQRSTNRRRLFFANKSFPLFGELKSLILKASPTAKGALLNRIKKLGNIKLVILSGIFLNCENSRADLLIVGDNLKARKVDAFLEKTESEVGKEINLVTMGTEEFSYRLDMHDRFVRDMLDFPHEKLLDKIRLKI